MKKSPTKTPAPKPDNPEQSKRFEETARELEADESGKSFEKVASAVLPPKSGGRKPKELPKAP